MYSLAFFSIFLLTPHAKADSPIPTAVTGSYNAATGVLTLNVSWSWNNPSDKALSVAVFADLNGDGFTPGPSDNPLTWTSGGNLTAGSTAAKNEFLGQLASSSIEGTANPFGDQTDNGISTTHGSYGVNVPRVLFPFGLADGKNPPLASSFTLTYSGLTNAPYHVCVVLYDIHTGNSQTTIDDLSGRHSPLSANPNYNDDNSKDEGFGGNTVSCVDPEGSITFPTADLSLTKTVNNATPNLGTNVVFTITVFNNGSSNATGVTVKDLLPAGLTYVSDNSGGNYNSGTGIWTVGAIANGASASIQITATVATAGAKTNYAQVNSSDQPDTDSTPGDNSNNQDDDDDETITPQTCANNISSPSGCPTAVNIPLAYPLDVPTSQETCANPSDNGCATWTFTNLPYNGDPNCPVTLCFTPSQGCGLANGNLCMFESNGSGGCIYAGTVGDKNPVCKILTASSYQVTLCRPGSGPVSLNEISITTCGADLHLTKTVNNATPNVGSNVTFTITVTNGGPSGATGVEVKDQLPAGYTYVSDNGAGAYVNATGIWTVGALTSGQSKSLQITATVNATGPYANYAQVSDSDQSDPDSTPNDNSTNQDDDDTVTPVPVAVADLSLTKTVDNNTPNVGSNVVFTISVTNGGPSAASSVQVKDQLPSGYSYVSDNGAGAYNNGTGIWTVGALTNGQTKSLQITATVLATGSYANYAQVTASGQNDPDSTPNDNSTNQDDDDTVTPVPVAVADLSLTKTVDNNTPNVGSNVVFTISVTNGGPSAASGVTVKDLLPAGLAYVSDNSGGNYNSVSGIWTVGTINNGASASILITATVTTSGNKTNYAQVQASGQTDPDSTPGNSSTSEDDDDEVTLCGRSVMCNNLPNVDMEGCAGNVPAAISNPATIFTYVACGATVTMSHSDVGDTNFCGDGDGVDFTRTYTLFFNGVAQTPTCSHTIEVYDTQNPQIVDIPNYTLPGCNAGWPNL
ncbi:MAG: DUF11 domain-containing protein, partial [Saprospiraceae bacterium]